MSTHFDKFIAGVLMVLQMGLPGGGRISLCILGRKFMFPAFGGLLIIDLLGRHL